MYKAIIFDFFDVIRTDPYQAWLRRHGLAREGKYAEAPKPLDKGELALPDFYKKLEALSGHPAASVEFEYSRTKAVDKNMVPLLGQLKRRYKLGLLSNASSEYIRGLLNRHSLERHFHTVVISAEVGYIKPEPEIFYSVLERLAVDAPQAVFIDDNLNYLGAARKLGLTGIQYTNLQSLKAEFLQLGIQW